jgi:hypothetical protein
VPTKKEERLILVRKQGGISPLTGRLLAGKRLETHHDVELYQGGLNVRANKQALSIAEHLALHFRRSVDPNRDQETRQREQDLVRGRWKQLTVQEQREMVRVALELTGLRIRVTPKGTILGHK